MNMLTTNTLAEAGVGLYSFADAGRYTGVPARYLRRWVEGYSFIQNGYETFSPPLWKSEIEASKIDVDGIGFRDLLELRFVSVFRSCGVPLNIIRQTICEAQRLFDRAYPFSNEHFRTDGRRIFLDVVEANGTKSLIDIVRRQNVIEKVIGPSLRKGIEFEGGNAARWFPLAASKAVVFDPARKFGQPILTESGVPTVAIAAAVAAEGGNQNRVARAYGVSRPALRKALEFEAKVKNA